MYGDRVLARLGVAVFTISLLAPTAVARLAPSHRPALVASTVDATAVVDGVLVAELIAPEPIPSPTPAPTATPTVPPAPVPVPVPVLLPPPAAAPGDPGVLVTASWYGPGFYGNRLPCWTWLRANGLPVQFQADTWGVAHKTLPCGTMLRLRHGSNEVTVPVVDRGPYIAGREIDLSPSVKAALGCTDLCTVVMQTP